MEKNNAVVLVIVKLVFVTPVVTRRVYADAEFQIYPSRVDTSNASYHIQESVGG